MKYRRACNITRIMYIGVIMRKGSKVKLNYWGCIAYD